ncbi:probable beta-D-xylosidase 2 isoform X1 [Typha latifolia]
MAKSTLLLLLHLHFLLLFISSSSAAASRPAFACAPESPAVSLPFCGTSLPIRARVRDLVGRLTREEKIQMLVNKAAGVPRLGIAGYEWWSEALHGVSNVGPAVRFGGAFPSATSFPQVISSAASFNASLWEIIGIAVSDEARAMYNGGQAGLTMWSPNVNVFRDPRWGRGQETPGEDPTVSGRYAAEYVRGLQQPYGHNRLKLAACCKHYTAYDLDNWKGVDRFHFNAVVSKQDLEETFNVPFKACVVEGKSASIMCSYNQVNGIPSCADPNHLRNTIRGQWGLNGYIVSDCDSVDVLYNNQHYTSNPEDAAADTLKAGLDLDCGSFLAQHTGSAVQKGKVSDGDIDAAVTHTVAVQMRLGMYDGEPSEQHFGDLGPNDVCSSAHQELAAEAARQGIVLLKNNKRGALPLSTANLHTVAVIGPNSDATVTMIGNYAGVPCGYTSPLQGIGRYAKTIHQMGCTNVACTGDDQPIDAAVDAARQADATIMVVGLDQSIEAEGRDRESLLLPGRQQELVLKVAAASQGPTVLVLMCGGPVDVSFAENNRMILWVGYPGQAGGAAIADVIFGAYNPGGKLPVTWYPEEYVEKVPMTTMAMRADPSKNYPGRSYRFYTGPVVYPFGHGLSYTTFSHSLARRVPAEFAIPISNSLRANYVNLIELNRTVPVIHAQCDGLHILVHVDVKNLGRRDGTHTVLVYSSPPVGHSAPTKQLVAFKKVYVVAGRQIRVIIKIDVCKDLSFASVDGIRRIPIGDHNLQIGELTHSISVKVDGLRI